MSAPGTRDRSPAPAVDGASADDATADALAFLRDALRRPFDDGEIRVITIPAPAADPARLLRLDPDGPAVYWSAAGTPPVAGTGEAARVAGAGEGRFQAVADGADALWGRVTEAAHPAIAPIPVRLYGGFAFAPGPLPGAWAPFGEAGFVLPARVYAAGAGPADDPGQGSKDGGRLAIAVAARDLEEAGADGVVARTRSLLARLAAPPPTDGGREDPTGREARNGREDGPVTAPEVVASSDSMNGEEWAAALSSIRERIAAGEAEKIVAARRRALRLAAPADPVAVLGRLAGTAAEARFAFRRGTATFLGATPERLIAREGLEIRTDALAGSIDADRAGEVERADALRTSHKDAEEHAYVVRAIAEALEPLCERLEYPSRPRIQRLRHVLHLQTPFRGRLSRPVPVLELVARLHPTPAVGGTPTAAALAWIEGEEPGARGWYAAPVGWLDRNGDGDFVVALRSALLDGDRAWLWAGAGIVRDSDADAELAETEVKLRTMMDALTAAP